MLSEERFEEILKTLEEKKAITVIELTELLDASESTIRRDLNYLHNKGKLKKIHGGATSINISNNTKDEKVAIRYSLNLENKSKIAKYCANLIEENDFVFIDAGTTTELMADYITEKKASYVTNAIGLAKKMCHIGFKVFVLGGEIKSETEAIVGNEAISSLKKYNFTKGFFGTNGIHEKAGYSTPDISEAMVKSRALERCNIAYVLADESKFNKISSVTFGKIEGAIIVTTKSDNLIFDKLTEIVEVDKI